MFHIGSIKFQHLIQSFFLFVIRMIPLSICQILFRVCQIGLELPLLLFGFLRIVSCQSDHCFFQISHMLLLFGNGFPVGLQIPFCLQSFFFLANQFAHVVDLLLDTFLRQGNHRLLFLFGSSDTIPLQGKKFFPAFDGSFIGGVCQRIRLLFISFGFFLLGLIFGAVHRQSGKPFFGVVSVFVDRIGV